MPAIDPDATGDDATALVATDELHAAVVSATAATGGHVRVVDDVLVTRCSAFELRDCTLAVDVSSPGVTLAVLVPGTCSVAAARAGLLRLRYRAPRVD